MPVSFSLLATHSARLIVFKVASSSGRGLMASGTETGVRKLQTSVLGAPYSLSYERPYALQERATLLKHQCL